MPSAATTCRRFAGFLLLLCLFLACSPRRIVPGGQGLLPGNASALDYLDLLGLEDRILALPRTVDGYSDFLKRHPEAAGLPRLIDFKAESILSLKPSLVLSDATQSPETRDYVERAGIRVLILRPFRNLEDGKANLELIAGALDMDAGPVIRELEKREEALRSRGRSPGGDQAQAPRVLPWVYYGESHWTAGRDTGADYALRLAGAINVARELGLVGHKEIPIESILDSDPDAILVGDEALAARLRQHPRLKSLGCLEKDRILRLAPSLASCNSPFLIDAASEIRRQLLEMGLLP